MFGEQEDNLNQEANLPQPHSQSQEQTVSKKHIPSQVYLLGLYGLLLFLIVALLYQAIFIITYPSIDLGPSPTNRKPHQQQQRQNISVKAQHQQAIHKYNEARLKELKLIELQRQMLKLNQMIHSKSQYNQNLIAYQLEKQRRVRLKYWDLDSNKQKMEERRKQNNDSSYISNKVVVGQQVTHFPKIVWMYIEENITSQQKLTQLLISNLAQYLQLQGYDFYLVGQYNHRYFMSNRHEQQLGYVLVDLWHLAYETNLTANLKDHTFTIKKHLISLIMLSQLGGILIDKGLILTQDLSWLQNFKQLTLANRGRTDKPNVVGFYHANYTESFDQIQINQFQKKMVHLHPPLDPYFIAVSREGKNFIQEVLQRYYVLLEHPQKVKSILKEYHLRLKEISGDDPYFEAIFIASSWVIKRKQMQLDIQWQKSEKVGLRPLALDHYGIFLFNRVYGPLKYRFLFSQMQKKDLYSFISKMDYSQLANQFGNVSFVSYIPFAYHVGQFLLKAEEGKEEYAIVKDSFMGKFVYKGQNQPWIVDKDMTKKVYQIQSGVTWAIPKKVWVYSNTKSIVSRLCLHNILLAAKESNFELILLDNQNLKDYLKNQTLAKIKTVYEGAKLKSEKIVLSNIWAQLIKLAIINEQGGVWLDLPVFTLTNFDWITKIHQNRDVSSRAGRLPKILLFYHPIQSGFPYECDLKGCQMSSQLSFATGFIAAQPSTELISLWLEELIKNLGLDEKQFQGKLSNFNITYSFIRQGGELSKLTLKSIISVRNKRVEQKGINMMLDNFRVWLISSFTGLDKLKEYSNFEVGFNPNNLYLWSYPISQVTQLLGKFDYLLQITQEQEKYLNKQLVNPTTILIHPNSFFFQHVFNFTLLEQLITPEDTNHLKMIPQVPIQFPKLVWVYLESGGMEEDKRWLQNNIYYCRGYNFQIINQRNYHQFIKDAKDIQSLLEIVPKLLASDQTKQKLKQQLIIYAVLYSMGGIYIGNDIYLTQNIGWTKGISTNPYVVGNKDQVLNFAFYGKQSVVPADNSSVLSKGYIKQFLLAAVKQSFFINDLLKGYRTLLKTSVDNPNYFLSSSQIFHGVLEQLYKNKGFDGFLQHYGFATMDTNYFAQKLYHFSVSQRLNLIGKISQVELKQLIGPLSYMVRFDSIHQLLIFIKNKKIDENSFIVKNLHFQNYQFKFSAKVSTPVASKWQNLPKTMWYFQDDQTLSSVDKLSQAKVQKYSRESAFALMLINRSSMQDFIQPETLQVISKTMSNRNKRVEQSIQHYLQRLALLIQHGGIFLSNQYIPTQNFNWIFDPPLNSLIYNRYQAPPNLLHYCSTADYQQNVDERFGVRVADTSTMSFDFIATNKKNQFLTALYTEILQLISKNDEVLNSKLSKIGLDQKKWQTLTPQIITKTAYTSILEKKGRQIGGSGAMENIYDALRQFKVWAMALQSGPTKLSQPYFEDSSYDNLCLKSGDTVDEIFGAPQLFMKLNSVGKRSVEKGECHLLSYFKRYLIV